MTHPDHQLPEDFTPPADTSDHRADMADLRNASEAADAQWRCTTCKQNCGSRMVDYVQLSDCCSALAYRTDDSPRVALPQVVEVPVTDTLIEALDRVLSRREPEGVHRRELESLRVQMVIARINQGRKA